MTRSPGGRSAVAAYSVAIFLAAALAFSVQPMMGKFILPRFGGVPAVWTTAMLFFQVLLLAGYLYAHVSIKLLGARRQAVLHLGALGVAALWLPLAVPDPAGIASPALQVLQVLAMSVGVPFLVVTATGPMLQRWFSMIGHPASPDPYFLYATSNAGSMAGLLGYPLLVEPNLSLAGQRVVWSFGFGLLVLLLAASASWILRARPDVESARPPVAKLPLGRRLGWLGLAFIPSSLMLGVTTHFTTDIAPVPLLWVVPLALYLLTFIGSFAKRPWIASATASRLLPAALMPLILLLAVGARGPLTLLLGVHLTTFVLTAFVCHARLAEDRPVPAHLTEFFVWVSVGGALGGFFNAIVAPLLFDSVIEYPLVLVLATLARPGGLKRRDAIAVVIFAGIALGVASAAGWRDMGAATRLMVFGAALVPSALWVRMRVRFAGSIAAVVTIVLVTTSGAGSILVQDRSFFGVQSVVVGANGVHLIVHGGTIHGAQDPADPLQALTYYHEEGPAAAALAARPAQRVGVIGLGAGALACHAAPGSRWTFYEIDPLVESFARDRDLFTYLDDCPAESDVVIGDGRIMLGRSTTMYDVLILDAFNSDAVPIHLLTREAVATYISHLRPGGMLLFNASNHYIDLVPLIASLADDAGLVLRRYGDTLTAEDILAYRRPSVWVALAREEEGLGRLATDPRWDDGSQSRRVPVWTDDYSNILTLIRL